MTHSQEARVSSTQDSLRLTETSNNISASVNGQSSSSFSFSTSSSFYTGSSGSNLITTTPPAAASTATTTNTTTTNNKTTTTSTPSPTVTASATTVDDGSGKVSLSVSENDDNKIENTFPWVKSFNAECRKAVGCRSVKVLENLQTVFLQHISIDVKNCYLKPNRGAKLKKCMLEALLFFHMYYQEVQEPMVYQFYYIKMADLMSMYVDMEIIAARRKKETTKRVVGRITSCLHIFLDKSNKYMLDAVLKAKMLTRANKELCTPVLGKLMTNVRITQEETPHENELMYVRCLLAFKLWKKMFKSIEEKKKITELALQKLIVPRNFLEKSTKEFAAVLPRIPPKKRDSITLFFMQAKFNLKPASEAFIKICMNSPSQCDKHMFFGNEHDDSPSSIGLKTVDVTPRSGNLLNSLWTNISVVSPSNGTKSGDRGRVRVKSGKKQKSEKSGKKVKKSNTGKKLNENIEGTSKKKKKIKNKAVSGVAISVFNNVSSIAGNDVKKKKKKAVVIGVKQTKAPPRVQEKHVSSEQQVIEIKIEENGQDVGSGSTEVSKETESRGMNQVNEINSVGHVGEVAPVEQKETADDVQLIPAIPMVVETPRDWPVPDASDQVNQINSVCSESQNLESQVVATTVSNGASSVSQNLRNELGVVSVNDAKAQEERHLPSNCDDAVLTSVANVNRVIGESVIVPSSSSTINSLEECLVNTSQKPQPTAIIENEAVPSTLNQANQETSNTDMVAPRIIHPYLVQSQTCDGNETTNVVPQQEAILNVCDSSIKLEDSLQEQSGCVPVVSSVPIPDEGCGGVDNDFNRICPIEYDSDAEILSDLTQHRSIPEEERENILVRNERDLLPRDSVHSNIFATENSDLLIEALGDVLPVSSIDLDNRVLCNKDVIVDSTLLGAGEEGSQFESPPIDPMNENEKRSLESMVNSIRSSKDTGYFAHYGTERQVWLRSGSENKFLFSNCDYMFGSNHNYYNSLLPVRENALATSNFMDEDDDIYERDDGYDRDLSSDEEVESVHEYNSSSTSSSPRMKTSGGKVGSHNLLMSVNEKDVLNTSSSSISDSPQSLKNIPVSSGIPLKKSTDSRNTVEKQRIGEKISTPLSITSAPASPITTTVTTSVPLSTLKNLNINLTKCTDINIVNTPKKVCRTPKVQSATNNRDTKVRNVNVSTNRFPDVVRDAQNATQNNEKDTTALVGQQKKPQGTILSESGKSVNNNIPGLYRHNLEMENRCTPPSIPYPTVPLTNAMNKIQNGNNQEYGCTCSVCYFNYLAYLNYGAPQGADTYRVPVQYHNSEIRSNMERLKSQDEELLRRIEASLADSKYSNSEPDVKDDEKVELIHKNVDSSLPLKKRLKTLTQIEETKVKSEILSTIKSSQADSFPSYPIRPMISIAELQLDKSIINKVQNETKPVRAPVSCMQKYPQYNGSNSYYNSTFNQSRENYFKRMYDLQFEQCRQYPISRSEIPKSSPVCKIESSDVSYRPSTNGMPISNLDSVSVDRKPIVANGLVNKRSENISIEFSDPYHNLKNNVQVQNPIFKTPAQLKETIPTSREYSVPKSEHTKTQVPPLIPIIPDASSTKSSASDNVSFVSIKQERNNMKTESKHVLDLSKQSQRGSRQKRNTSEVKPRKSKRIRRETVIHNPDLRDVLAGRKRGRPRKRNLTPPPEPPTPATPPTRQSKRKGVKRAAASKKSIVEDDDPDDDVSEDLFKRCRRSEISSEKEAICDEADSCDQNEWEVCFQCQWWSEQIRQMINVFGIGIETEGNINMELIVEQQEESNSHQGILLQAQERKINSKKPTVLPEFQNSNISEIPSTPSINTSSEFRKKNTYVNDSNHKNEITCVLPAFQKSNISEVPSHSPSSEMFRRKKTDMNDCDLKTELTCDLPEFQNCNISEVHSPSSNTASKAFKRKKNDVNYCDRKTETTCVNVTDEHLNSNKNKMYKINKTDSQVPQIFGIHECLRASGKVTKQKYTSKLAKTSNFLKMTEETTNAGNYFSGRINNDCSTSLFHDQNFKNPKIHNTSNFLKMTEETTNAVKYFSERINNDYSTSLFHDQNLKKPKIHNTSKSVEKSVKTAGKSKQSEIFQKHVPTAMEDELVKTSDIEIEMSCDNKNAVLHEPKLPDNVLQSIIQKVENWRKYGSPWIERYQDIEHRISEVVVNPSETLSFGTSSIPCNQEMLLWRNRKLREEPPKRKKSQRNKQTKKAAAAAATATTVTNVPHTRIKSRQGFVLENIELQNTNTSGRRKR